MYLFFWALLDIAAINCVYMLGGMYVLVLGQDYLIKWSIIVGQSPKI